jgi:hypothetical protein
MFSTGLDGAILAGAFGEEILKASRPALVTTQAPQKIDSTEITLLPAERPLSVHTNGTIKQVETQPVAEISALGLGTPRSSPSLTPGGDSVLQRPGGDDGLRGPPNLLNYSGDFDGVNGQANEFGTSVPDARVFDGYRIRGNPVKDCFFSHNLMNFTGVVAANVKIVGPGTATAGVPNGGLPVVLDAKAVPATQAATGLSGFGFTDYEIKACGLKQTFPQGHYYVNVQPIGFGSGRSFQSTTSGGATGGSGANGTVPGPGFGGPINNGDAYFDSPSFGAVWTSLATQDYSGGVCQNSTC